MQIPTHTSSCPEAKLSHRRAQFPELTMFRRRVASESIMLTLVLADFCLRAHAMLSLPIGSMHLGEKVALEVRLTSSTGPGASQWDGCLGDALDDRACTLEDMHPIDRNKRLSAKTGSVSRHRCAYLTPSDASCSSAKRRSTKRLSTSVNLPFNSFP